MILVVTECLLGGCLRVACFCYCCLCFKYARYIFVRLQVFGSVVWYLIVLPVQWVFWMWLFCGVHFMYIIYSRQAHSITRIIIYSRQAHSIARIIICQLEFNYIA
jgi:hypothetical protein